MGFEGSGGGMGVFCSPSWDGERGERGERGLMDIPMA